MTKLKLKKDIGRTELANGSFRQAFEPGEIYDIERQETLAFLLNQNLFDVVSADVESAAIGGLPEDFPMRHVFEREGFASVAEIQSKSRDELIAVDGIGEKTADAALRYGGRVVEDEAEEELHAAAAVEAAPQVSETEISAPVVAEMPQPAEEEIAPDAARKRSR